MKTERHQGRRPAVGSPLWIHMTAVSVAGTVVLAWALTQLGITGLDYLAHNPSSG